MHATGQVVHVDVEKEFARRQAAGRAQLPSEALAGRDHRARRSAAPDFHARFSASGRAYLYRIINRRAPLALEEGRAWLVNAPLDAAAMHEAAQVLVGKHDFSTFRASLCQAQSPVKTLTRLDVVARRRGDPTSSPRRAPSCITRCATWSARLRLVGEGKWSRDDVHAALEARDRTKGGPTAPPHGLYLTGVKYDPAARIARTTAQHQTDRHEQDHSA